MKEAFDLQDIQDLMAKHRLCQAERKVLREYERISGQKHSQSLNLHWAVICAEELMIDIVPDLFVTALMEPGILRARF